ncbi:hypothetical protein HYY74_07020 [Candidatus Woesearchaeota archaeon]|nr:hypothetical protein [Candidatus Woesearchaeota archaeon]
MLKKGQVSAFIIAGILILVVVGLFSINRTELSKIPRQPGQAQTPQIQLEQEALSLQSYMSSCLQEALREAQGIGVNERDRYAAEKLIEQEARECSDFTAYEARGVTVEKGEPAAKITQSEDVLSASVNYPLTVKTSESELSFSSFNAYVKRKAGFSLDSPGPFVFPDSLAEFSLPDGLSATMPDGKREITVQIKEEDLANPENSVLVLSTVYDLKPDGAKFDPPLLLTIKLPARFTPEQAAKFKAVYWDKSKNSWEQFQRTYYDAEKHAVIAEVTHFTHVGISGDPECTQFPPLLKGFTNDFGKVYADPNNPLDSLLISNCCTLSCYHIAPYDPNEPGKGRRVYGDLIFRDNSDVMCEASVCVNNNNYIGIYTGREKRGNDYISTDNSKCKDLTNRPVNPEGREALLKGCGASQTSNGQPPPAAPPAPTPQPGGQQCKADTDLGNCIENGRYCYSCAKKESKFEFTFTADCNNQYSDQDSACSCDGKKQICKKAGQPDKPVKYTECANAAGQLKCSAFWKNKVLKCAADGFGQVVEECAGNCQNGQCAAPANRCEGKAEPYYCDKPDAGQEWYRCQEGKELAKSACNENQACVIKKDSKGLITLPPCESRCPAGWKFTGTYGTDNSKWSQDGDPWLKYCDGNKQFYFNSIAKGARCEKPVNNCKASGTLKNYPECSAAFRADQVCAKDAASILVCTGKGEEGIIIKKCAQDTICTLGFSGANCDPCPSPPSGEKDFTECKDNYNNRGLIENYCGSGCNHDFIIECSPPCSDPKRIPCLQNPGVRQKKPCEHGCVMVKSTQGAEEAQCAASPSQPTPPGPGAAPPGTQPPGTVPPPPAALAECNGKSANDKVCGQGNNANYVITCSSNGAGAKEQNACANGCQSDANGLNAQCKAGPPTVAQQYTSTGNDCPFKGEIYFCGADSRLSTFSELSNYKGTDSFTDLSGNVLTLPKFSVRCKGKKWEARECKNGCDDSKGNCLGSEAICPKTKNVQYIPDTNYNSYCAGKKSGYANCIKKPAPSISIYCDAYGNACASRTTCTCAGDNTCHQNSPLVTCTPDGSGCFYDAFGTPDCCPNVGLECSRVGLVAGGICSPRDEAAFGTEPKFRHLGETCTNTENSRLLCDSKENLVCRYGLVHAGRGTCVKAAGHGEKCGDHLRLPPHIVRYPDCSPGLECRGSALGGTCQILGTI